MSILIGWELNTDQWIRKLIKPRGIDALVVFRHCWALLIFHTASSSILGHVLCQFLLPVNLNLSPHCLMWQNYTSESEPNSKIHPFETFRLSMDEREYSDFESTIIRPSIRAARYRDALFANSHLTELPVTFAPGRQSIVDIQRFLIDTDYNQLPINIHPHSFGETAPMPQVIPLDRVFYIKGYFSKKQPGCFVWEEGHFEDGEQVIFGTSGRLGRVLGVCEVGKNYIMFKVEDMSGVPEGDVRIWGIVVLALPIGFQLSWTQHFIMRYLRIFLRSLVKFADKEHIEEGMESDSTKVGEDSELEFSELTQSTEMREAEYSAESEESE